MRHTGNLRESLPLALTSSPSNQGRKYDGHRCGLKMLTMSVSALVRSILFLLCFFFSAGKYSGVLCIFVERSIYSINRLQWEKRKVFEVNLLEKSISRNYSFKIFQKRPPSTQFRSEIVCIKFPWPLLLLTHVFIFIKD